MADQRNLPQQLECIGPKATLGSFFRAARKINYFKKSKTRLASVVVGNVLMPIALASPSSASDHLEELFKQGVFIAYDYSNLEVGYRTFLNNKVPFSSGIKYKLEKIEFDFLAELEKIDFFIRLDYLSAADNIRRNANIAVNFPGPHPLKQSNWNAGTSFSVVNKSKGITGTVSAFASGNFFNNGLLEPGVSSANFQAKFAIPLVPDPIPLNLEFSSNFSLKGDRNSRTADILSSLSIAPANTSSPLTITSCQPCNDAARFINHWRPCSRTVSNMTNNPPPATSKDG
jgi:hypothetical protein